MPKSKRNKVVHLTKVKKKDRSVKSSLINQVREALQKYSFVYIFSLENQRNAYLKIARDKLNPGRIFYGKNKVMQLALGLRPENEIFENIHIIAQKLCGNRGLLFSNSSPEEVKATLDNFQPEDFAKSGFVSLKTIILKEGTQSLDSFPQSLEPQFRKLGLPTLLKSSKIHLMGDFTLCTQGKMLTPEQSQLLKLLGIKMARFKVTIEASWHKNEVSEYL